MTEQQKKRMSIRECQRSLPIFPFKDDFIAAVREYQVRDCRQNRAKCQY